MGLSIISWAGLFRTLRRVVRSCVRTRGAHSSVVLRRHSGMQTAAGRGHVAWPSPGAGRPGRPGRPVRVLRVVDAGHAPSTAGRMVISGRMADVCAELDRLAALEAAAA